jgi:site-specific DNA recombinase
VRLEPAEAVIVQELFARYSEEAVSLNGLATQLHAQSIPGPHGQARWSPSSIRRMLMNPVYTGQLYADRIRAVPIRQRGPALRPVGQSAQSWVLRPISVNLTGKGRERSVVVVDEGIHRALG